MGVSELQGTGRGVSVIRPLLYIVLLVLFVGCTAQVAPPTKIVLLSSFEGRYREVGYDALYAARLALSDAGYEQITLLPIDDGGTELLAADRIHALENDPSVEVILASGLFATSSTAQAALNRLPMLIIGHWNTAPHPPQTYMLANPALDDLLTESNANIQAMANFDAPLVGSEILSLWQFPMLRDDLSDIQIVSSATLPDASFTERYGAGDQFAPDPNLLATLTYDATRLVAESIVTNTLLSEITYDGLNGTIAFDENGYWREAPINVYQYDESRRLVPIEN